MMEWILVSIVIGFFVMLCLVMLAVGASQMGQYLDDLGDDQ